jgi:general secretion pathway protein G
MKILLAHHEPTQPANRGQGGFTLVELLLVLTILAILAGIVLPKMTGNTERARETSAVTQIQSFGTALDAYEVDNGNYPRQLQDLVVKPRDALAWHGPYVEKIPTDPWQKPYMYQYPGRRNASGAKGYDLYTTGPDGRVYANFATKN